MRTLLLVIITAAFLLGCAGQAKELQMRDPGVSKTDVRSGMKTIVLPNGTIFGGTSKEQASMLAQIFVESHNMAMNEMEEIKDIGKKSLKNQETIKNSAQRIEESTQKILELSQRNLETAQKALQMIEQLSKKQGTGEMTIFFPVGKYQIPERSLEYERVVNFADYLSRESKGRKVLFISIGSASAFGDKKRNQKLAKKRSEAPIEILDKYLVNIPHEFFKVYNTGDFYSPKNVTMKEHLRYQHARIIAFFDTDQIPLLPEELVK